MHRSLLVGVLVAGCVSGCGGSSSGTASDQSAGSQSAPAAGSGQEAAPSAQQGFEQMMQGLQKMTEAGKQAGVTLVDYEVLKGLLPELGGWQRSDEKGQQVTMGIAVSNAEARYTKGEASMKLEIIDTSFSQMIIAPVMMFARSGFEERSDDGYKKGLTLAGYPGFESWEKPNRDAEVHLLVGERFLINVEANNVDGPEPARALAQAVDLKKLAGLK